MYNKKIRNIIKQSGIKQWEIAEEYGIHEGNFSRLLRKQLTEPQERRVLEAIEHLKSKKDLQSQHSNLI